MPTSWGCTSISEADIESHAFWGTCATTRATVDQWVERVARMVTARPAPPVGDRLVAGQRVRATAPTTRRPPAWVRARGPVAAAPLRGRDPVRLAAGDERHATSSARCTRRSTRSSATRRPAGSAHPLIMCEYSHAMGNSNGTLAEYWDAIESTPGLQGGFIWEWRDHGLVQRKPDGTDALRVRRRLRRRAQRRHVRHRRDHVPRPVAEARRCGSTSRSRRRCGSRPVPTRPATACRDREPRLSSATLAGCAPRGPSRVDGAARGQRRARRCRRSRRAAAREVDDPRASRCPAARRRANAS